MTTAIRCPIITVLGHVDSGKTSLLDKIRSTLVGVKEVERITQHVGASEIPIDTIKKVCGSLFEKIGSKITLPGILTIDTPGHEAFTSLRERGGSIADLAILVVDIMVGMQQQTKEAIQILKSFKVPFVVAANKVDIVPFWKSSKNNSVTESFKIENAETMRILDEKVYTIVGELSALGIRSERFDRVSDFTKDVSIIPTSAITGEGISELLMVLTGLAQKYLEEQLKINVEGNAKGTILEVKETKGLGKTIDAIIYDGTLRKTDTLVIVGRDKPIVTNIRSLLKPAPLSEIRDKSTKFNSVDEVHAAAGVKIVAPNIEEVIPGMPFEAAATKEDVERITADFQKEIGGMNIHVDSEGIVLKADTLGSLEALIKLLKQNNIPVSYAQIGDVTQNDAKRALFMSGKNEFFVCILAFNVKITDEAKSFDSVKIIDSKVIYHLIEEYNKWKNGIIEDRRAKELQRIVFPAKITVLPGYLFRQSKPCITGVEVLLGKIKSGYELINSLGEVIGKISNVQDSGKQVKEAKIGDRVAVSIDGAHFGKNLNDNDILYTHVNVEDYQLMKTKLKSLLTEDQIAAMREILEIYKKKDPFWGS